MDESPDVDSLFHFQEFFLPNIQFICKIGELAFLAHFRQGFSCLV